MTYSDIPRLLTMTIVWLLLLVWYLNAYRSSCLVTLGLLAVLTLILFVSGAEIALRKRRVLLKECLEPRSFLFRLFERRYLLVTFEILKSTMLALLLVVGVLDFAPRHWSLLFADVLLLGLLVPRFYGLLIGQLREEYRFATARYWAMWVSTVLLWLESLIVLGFADGHNYIGLRWQEVITYGADDTDVRCAPLAALTSLLSAVNAMGQWSVQNLTRSLADLPQALVASISLLVVIVLSFLLAYAYSRALIGAVGRPWTMWRIEPRPRDLSATPART